MLQFAGQAHDGGLAVALHRLRPTQRLRQFARHADPKLLQRLHEWLDVLDIAASKRVLDHRQDGAAQARLLQGRATVVPDLVDEQLRLANVDLAHADSFHAARDGAVSLAWPITRT